MSDFGKLVGVALQAVGSLFRPTGWQQRNEEAGAEATLRLARDVNRLKVDGSALIAHAAGSLRDLGAASGATLDSALAALDEAAAQSEDPYLRRSVADLSRSAEARPLDAEAVALRLEVAAARLAAASPRLSASTRAAAADGLIEIERALREGSARVRTDARVAAWSAAWTGASALDLGKTWLNGAIDNVVNYGGGLAAGTAGGAITGAAIGAFGGPAGAVVGFAVGAAVGAVGGLFGGATLGRAWRALG
ncbi:MAG: hypothetical protein FJZ01_02285 [Candidatus Sericytochromatia bacterium]|nr:hypothetical protein [Candidatus Tanganyikabacteria bacterium]